MFEIITIPRGDSFALAPSSIKDEFGVVASSLTGWDFIFVVKSSLVIADSAAEITLLRTAMTISGAALRVVVAPALLQPLTIGKVYYYALKAKSPTGGIITQAQGILCVQVCAAQAFPASEPGLETVITTETGAQITSEDGSPIVTG